MGKYQDTRTFKQYTLLCSDGDNAIYYLLEEISKQTDMGHSFDVIVDPVSKHSMTFFIDGDGADKIHSIDVKQVEKTYEFDFDNLRNVEEPDAEGQ